MESSLGRGKQKRGQSNIDRGAEDDKQEQARAGKSRQEQARAGKSRQDRGALPRCS
jgi:hypothetical protein